jgi:hypothetical protein
MEQVHKARRSGISLDWWSVIGALAAAAAVRFSILPHIPW